MLTTVSKMYVYVLFFMLQLRFASYLINEYVMLCYVMINCGKAGVLGSVPGILIH